MILGHFIKYTHWPVDPDLKDHFGILAINREFGFRYSGREPMCSDKKYDYFVIPSDWEPQAIGGVIRLIPHNDPEHGPYFDIEGEVKTNLREEKN